MKKLVILGGSTPFTISLIDALRIQETPAHALTLHGRNNRSLSLVSKYAKNALTNGGWRVTASTNLSEALHDARLVLHQIRYGDMQGRAEDEAFAVRMNVAVDETLGPAALRRALLLRNPLKHICQEILSHCPNAWVINLTNPLSVVTSLMTEFGISNCLGLCELPKITAQSAISSMDLCPETSQWTYAGLNHRGFVINLRDEQSDGMSRLEEMAVVNPKLKLAGFATKDIVKLQSVPGKYFHLMSGAQATAAGRAEILSALRNTLLEELESAPCVRPPSLSLRSMQWYSDSVVPFINSFSGKSESDHVVNLTDSDGLTRELPVAVSYQHIARHQPALVPVNTKIWIDRYETHERALLELVREPSYELMEKVLRLDPLVSEEMAPFIASEMMLECRI